MILSVVLLSAIVVLAAYSFLVEPYMIRITRIELAYPDLPESLDGLTICHLSDIHAVKAGRLEARLGAILANLDVDLCAVTGDIISGKQGLSALRTIFKEFRPKLGSFAVLGNGDYRVGVETEDIGHELNANGVRLLINESATVSRNGGRLCIIGVDDPHRGRDDLSRAVEGIPSDGFKVLLAHSPDIMVKVEADTADLVLAGHTHGGQVRLPFIGALWLNCHHRLSLGEGHFDPHMLGETLDRELPRTHLYVSRGVGGSGVRARFLCPPEIAVITLSKAGV